jgi:hypothetical protein
MTCFRTSLNEFLLGQKIVFSVIVMKKAFIVKILFFVSIFDIHRHIWYNHGLMVFLANHLCRILQLYFFKNKLRSGINLCWHICCPVKSFYSSGVFIFINQFKLLIKLCNFALVHYNFNWIKFSLLRSIFDKYFLIWWWFWNNVFEFSRRLIHYINISLLDVYNAVFCSRHLEFEFH